MSHLCAFDSDIFSRLHTTYKKEKRKGEKEEQEERGSAMIRIHSCFEKS